MIGEVVKPLLSRWKAVPLWDCSYAGTEKATGPSPDGAYRRWLRNNENAGLLVLVDGKPVLRSPNVKFICRPPR